MEATQYFLQLLQLEEAEGLGTATTLATVVQVVVQLTEETLVQE
jgi:hypothetical protein